MMGESQLISTDESFMWSWPIIFVDQFANCPYGIEWSKELEKPKV